MNDLIQRLEHLGAQGFIVSIVYGPCGDKKTRYSVNVMNKKREMFEKPFAAESLEKAMQVAEEEIRKRGWALAEQ